MTEGRPGTHAQRHLVMVAGRRRFAVPGSAVREIRGFVGPLRAGPAELPEVLGWAPSGTDAVPAVDLGRIVSADGPAPMRPRSMVIVQGAAGGAGLVVDRVTQVVSIHPRELRPAGEADGARAGCVRGVVDRPGGKVAVLDVTTLVGSLPLERPGPSSSVAGRPILPCRQ